MISAVFLVVVLSLLAAVIVNVANANQVGQARDVLAGRAYFMARAGLEWGFYTALRNGNCPASVSLPAGASTLGFTVVVGCLSYGPYDEGGRSVAVYRITSTASRGTPGALDRAERQLVATVSSP